MHYVSFCDGELTEGRCLRQAYKKYDCFYILNDKAVFPVGMEGKTYRYSVRGFVRAEWFRVELIVGQYVKLYWESHQKIVYET